MINIAINNESLYKTAQELGHHCDAAETIENALQVYITHLQRNSDTKINKNKKPRVFGQHRGLITMSDDFDETLPDSFWLGNDE
jgi:hypothetical protein